MEAEFMRKRVIELEHGGKAEESEAGCGNHRRPASPLGHPPSARRDIMWWPPINAATDAQPGGMPPTMAISPSDCGEVREAQCISRMPYCQL
jgi:hypothetical protein